MLMRRVRAKLKELPAQVFIESFQRVLAARRGQVEVAGLSWLGIGSVRMVTSSPCEY